MELYSQKIRNFLIFQERTCKARKFLIFLSIFLRELSNIRAKEKVPYTFLYKEAKFSKLRYSL